MITAVFAAFTGRVQTDIKTALTFASLTQVGIIVAEIGIVAGTGIDALYYIPLIHILGHGCLRTLQFLRAPTLLHDYRIMENAIGDRLPRMPGFWEQAIPRSFSVWFYRLAMERGYLDGWLNGWIVAPFLGLLHGATRPNAAGPISSPAGESRESDRPQPTAGTFDELL